MTKLKADIENTDVNISAQDCQNLDSALGLEWLETNGRGGFSSGTVARANTRRYHALLLARSQQTNGSCW
jgi:hypothetical protein